MDPLQQIIIIFALGLQGLFPVEENNLKGVTEDAISEYKIGQEETWCVESEGSNSLIKDIRFSGMQDRFRVSSPYNAKKYKTEINDSLSVEFTGAEEKKDSLREDIRFSVMQDRFKAIPFYNVNKYKTGLSDSLSIKLINAEEKKDSLKTGIQYSAGQDRFNVTPLHKANEYETGINHTLLINLKNTGEEQDSLKTSIQLPKEWDLITNGIVGALQSQEEKLVLISFYIPSNTPPGDVSGFFQVKGKDDRILQSTEINFKISNSHKLEVNKIVSPQFVQAGERIDTRFEIKNNGNVTEEIKLSSRNSIQGELIRTIAPDSAIIIQVSQETNSRNYFINTINSDIEVLNTVSNKVYKAYGITKVFPSKIEQKDPFFRFPMQISSYYNSYTNKDEHFSTMSFEFKGNGYMDLNKNHYLNFILRGPNQNSIKRFGMNDQYSFIYKYKNQTTLFLGDHSYYINRLGFSGRYGMGFRLDQEINNWTLSAFYTKPRLYSFYNKPLFGAKVMYHFSDSLTIGASVVKSSGNEQSYNKNINSNEKGQILVLELEYMKKKMRIQAESSVSITREHVDFANYFNLSQGFGNLRYTGNATIAGKNYLGTLNNSLRFGNNLNYALNKWNFAVGQGFSKINQRLDPLLYGTEPSFQNYFASVRYRFNNHHSANIRVDMRNRKDEQIGAKNFHYKEHGIDYRYRYTNNSLAVSFNGRIAKTQNLLSLGSDSRITYGHYFNVNYLVFPKFTLRGNLSHNYTNRYGNSNGNTNYYRYGAGFNYRLNRNYRMSMNYNSGYSPEENYQKRDFVNASVVTRLSKNHHLEARVNYYANPGSGSKKEWYAFLKYSFTFGAPLKKVLKQGGVSGRILSNNPNINVKGGQIVAAGNSVRSDSKGKFELNNLPLGTNYIIVDQSNLPANVVPSVKMPFKVEIKEKQKTSVNIELVRAGNVHGKLKIDSLKNDDSKYNLTGYLKLYNEEFTYYIESDKAGNFKFQHIVPGNYKIALIRLKKEEKLIPASKAISVLVSEGATSVVNITLKVKERKIKFRDNNFKVGL